MRYEYAGSLYETESKRDRAAAVDWILAGGDCDCLERECTSEALRAELQLEYAAYECMSEDTMTMISRGIEDAIAWIRERQGDQ